ncbi:MAG: acetyl-CoA decarbonylase/synthase complex subunit gamma [Thermoanaerobacterales bacterium]|nr:acetyl-CoA decarbonylase/synthase complex subunit gamma [Thermoanaerobacterales bacterium]
MALTGLQIFKLLPKTNCRDCGFATCMAFAMALAAGKASLEACAHASDEARATLGAAAEPPVRLIAVGRGENAVELGGEVVLFRHEKTFYHPTAVAIEVRDDLPEPQLVERLQRIHSLAFERVGLTMRVDMVAVRQTGPEAEAFVGAVRLVRAHSPLPLILATPDPAAMRDALGVCAAERPLLWGATESNREAMASLAREHNCPLVVTAQDPARLAGLSEEIIRAGHRDIILHAACSGVGDTLRAATAIRRMAIKKRFRPFGLPILTSVSGNGDAYRAVLEAGTYVAKYASIVVVDTVEPAVVLPLLTLRQDIYTDPQKPIQVEATCYTIGNPGRNAPVLVTTNFSLTYFSVVNEVEASRIGSYLVTVDTDGTSVLTAWASGKFGAEQISEALDKTAVGERVDHRRVIIPGYVAVLSGRLADLSGWEVSVGPREAAGIPAFLRAYTSGRAG